MSETTQVSTEPGTITVVPTAGSSVSTVEPKAGVKTSEFSLTVATFVAFLLTALFHQDFAGYVPAIALIVAGVGTVGYALARAHVKKPVASGLDPALLTALTDAAATMKAAAAALPERTAQATAEATAAASRQVLIEHVVPALEARTRPDPMKPERAPARSRPAARAESAERRTSTRKTTARKRAAKR